MPHSLPSRFFAALTALGLTIGPALADRQPPDVIAAWSQIIGHTTPQASAPAAVEMRFVIQSQTDACGQFRVAAPGLAASDVQNQGRTPVARPQYFDDITVCRLDIPGVQAQLYDATGNPVRLVSKMNLHNFDLDAPWIAGPADQAQIIVAGAQWIGRNGDLRVLTLGDTGCRGGGRQDCETWRGNDGWPLQQISEVGAPLAPDLVIHVGDFRYFRENTPGFRKDTSQLWQKDFFPIAQKLLMAAPWAMTRGNHEGCTNAALGFGIGYFQFFGQSDSIDCSDLGITLADGETPIYRSPWYFDVAPQGTTGTPPSHRFVMIDANDYEALAGVSFEQAKDHFTDAIAITAAGDMPAWWVWHSPAVQRITWRRQPFGDPTLRTALLAAAGLDKSNGARFCASGTPPNCNPSMFLLGHQHLYQDVRFAKNKRWIFPQSTIVGHGGVNLRDSNPAIGHTEYCKEDDFPLGTNGARTVTGRVNTVVDHGFVLWTQADGTASGADAQIGWTAQYSWVSDYKEDAQGRVTGTLGGLPHAQPETLPTCSSP